MKKLITTALILLTFSSCEIVDERVSDNGHHHGDLVIIDLLQKQGYVTKCLRGSIHKNEMFMVRYENDFGEAISCRFYEWELTFK